MCAVQHAWESWRDLPISGPAFLPLFTDSVRSHFVVKLRFQFVTMIYQWHRRPEMLHQMLSLAECFCFEAEGRADIKVGCELCS